MGRMALTATDRHDLNYMKWWRFGNDRHARGGLLPQESFFRSWIRYASSFQYHLLLARNAIGKGSSLIINDDCVASWVVLRRPAVFSTENGKTGERIPHV
jgi:hypothetical protein